MDKSEFLVIYKKYITIGLNMDETFAFCSIYLLNKNISVNRIKLFINGLIKHGLFNLFILYIITLESQKHSLIIIRDINNNIIKIY